MKQRLLMCAALLGAACGAYAEIPSGYYNALKGKTGADLKTAVYGVINPHTEVSSYQNLPQYFQRTDVYPASSRWWDMYSDIERYIPSFSGLNREHSFPKSWWGGDQNIPAYVDLNHLYPADGPANQAKSNYPLGVVTGTPKYDNGVSLVGYPVSGQGGGAQYVYEPADEYKGDFARTYFYMVTCYQNLTWSKSYLWMVQNNTYPTLTPWAVDLLLKWNAQDKPSQKELDRNEVVYSIQNNRNPFIDFPELAEYIWGSKNGEAFDPGTSTTPAGDPVIVSPVSGMYLDYGEVAVGNSQKALLYVKTENFTKDISLTLAGANKEMFAISTKKIGYQNANIGYWLQVTYTPTAIGTHEAKITLYDGNITGSFVVNIKGEALDVPTLSQLTAYEASNITSDSYTASWSESPETVDFYQLTRNIYAGTDMRTETMECDGTSTEVEGFSAADYETYYVQGSRLGYLSTPSNTITVAHSGISGIETDKPLTVETYRGMVRIRCSEAHSDLRIVDMSGRIVYSLPEVTDGVEIPLPYGVFVLTTATHSTPIKIAVY